MKRKAVVMMVFGLVMLLVVQCLDPYGSPSSQSEQRFLTVDAFLNWTNATCVVKLTRTVSLVEQELPPVETGATVWIEDENGVPSPLNEITPGQYTGWPTGLTESSKVKLKIKTVDGTEFESEMVSILRAASLDTITFRSERTGVSINVTAHNGSEDSRYYYWRYVDTWVYTARYLTAYVVDADLQLVPITEKMFECWKSESSKDILIATSTTLQDDSGIVSDHNLVILPWDSPKLQRRYSILLEQRAISKATYEYLDLLRKNTENLGTLFDPLPGHPMGNLRCVTRPNEIVLGNFDASTVQQKRIFIDVSDIQRPPGTGPRTGYEGCVLVDVRGRADWINLAPVKIGNEPVMGTSKFCVDCRLMGGVTVAPDFWEE